MTHLPRRRFEADFREVFMSPLRLANVRTRCHLPAENGSRACNYRPLPSYRLLSRQTLGAHPRGYKPQTASSSAVEAALKSREDAPDPAVMEGARHSGRKAVMGAQMCVTPQVDNYCAQTPRFGAFTRTHLRPQHTSRVQIKQQEEKKAKHVISKAARMCYRQGHTSFHIELVLALKADAASPAGLGPTPFASSRVTGRLYRTGRSPSLQRAAGSSFPGQATGAVHGGKTVVQAQSASLLRSVSMLSAPLLEYVRPWAATAEVPGCRDGRRAARAQGTASPEGVTMQRQGGCGSGECGSRAQ
ncbi:hypothetical protein NDU88_007973 [Pleurodeles waltl]|uniref:Uncharacterized protein n=1 Tax=Pleurodeles waltl TaxID=8319 RepID=A0AAV7U2R3_PLEWA|nr:hypothetical protein NDU88_007973 [Pleurodeles waltl]